MPLIRMVALVAFALTCAAGSASAAPCTIRINASDIVIDPDYLTQDSARATRRERLLAWPGQSLNRLRGTVPNCRGDVALNTLAELEGLPDTDGYCLAEGDDDSGFLLVPGPRNFRGRCTKSTCERVNGAAEDVQSLAIQITEFAYGSAPDLTEAVRHPSGAAMLSAGKFALQRSLEGGASALVATAFGSPFAAGATTATLVTVGGGVWLCSR